MPRQIVRSKPCHEDLRYAATGCAELNDSAKREHQAYRFLEEAWYRSDGVFPCWVSPSPAFVSRSPVEAEIFTTMIVLDAMQTSRLSPTVKWEILRRLRAARSQSLVHHFFVDVSRLPADTDCTAIAHGLLWDAGLLTRSDAAATAERICRNTNREGIIQVYFTEDPGRTGVIDPIVCANALHYLAGLGLASRARPTERFVMDTLVTRAYEPGTRYYPSPDAFLYFCTRLLRAHRRMHPMASKLLREHVRDRIGVKAGPLDRAFRILAADALGVKVDVERHALSAMQRPDGAWPADAFFRYGRAEKYFGSEVVSTALSLRALSWGASRQRAIAPSRGRKGVAEKPGPALVAHP